ncbi:MAG: hypothetical protein ABR538_00055 [Candidatus Binatia bacterium]
MKTKTRIAMTLASLALASSASAADCIIDGNSHASSITSPVKTSTNSTFAGNLCGHSIHANSGTCYLRIDDNYGTSSSGTCLTVGRGVIVDGFGSTVSCTDASCGDAVAYNSGLGSGSTDVTDLNITGCFTRAAVGSSSASGARNLTRVNIDLAGSGCNGTFGALYWDVMDQVKIRNTAEHAISTDGIVRHSIISGSGIGILSSPNPTVKNVLMYDNAYSFSGTGGSLTSSVLLYSPDTICHCKVGSACQTDVDACIGLTSDPSIVDDEFIE